MKHQWPQFDHHDTKRHTLTDDEERELISVWQQSESFDDVIIEAQQTQGVGYER
ncbi:hypothetical protein ACTXMF_12205 [Psychrobacter celer]|uniref:hypothetical protein n=1 Tax=Psychrobacter celer TaxID=306572 RepID=UPI003FD5F67E